MAVLQQLWTLIAVVLQLSPSSRAQGLDTINGNRRTVQQSPLHKHAAAGDMQALADHIRRAGARLDEREADFGAAPLHLAAAEGQLAAATALLDAGADANARDMYGETPLHTACGVLHSSDWAAAAAMTELLLARGAERALTDENGLSALRMAKCAPCKALLLGAASAAEKATVALEEKMLAGEVPLPRDSRRALIDVGAAGEKLGTPTVRTEGEPEAEAARNPRMRSDDL